MTDGTRSLRDIDVEQISRLVDALDRSNLDYLRVEVGGTRLLVGRGSPPGATATLDVPPSTSVATPVQAPQPPSSALDTPAAAKSPGSAVAHDGAAAVASPLSGLLYLCPEPGAPPFVRIGSMVEQGATLALVEVMKVFNAVAAPVRGTVVEVCSSENDVVELNQTLFRIQPAVA